MFIAIPLEQRFWEKVNKTSTCWIWTGSRRHGYGRSQDRNKKVRAAHVISYEEVVGLVPTGMELDHLCHTRDATCLGGYDCPHRACVNPAHLEPVTHLENGRRGRQGEVNAARQRAKTRCKQGHPFDEVNTYINPDGSRHCRRCDADRHTNKRIKGDIRNQ